MADKTKMDVIKEAAKRTGIARSDCGVVYNSVMDTIRDMILRGDTIMLEGLGVFKYRKGTSHMLKNIHTGEVFTTPPVPTPVFIINIALRKEYCDKWAERSEK
jgi:nucleoid DNA-binding protein